MSGSQRSVAFRCLMMSTAALVLVTALVATPIFTRGSAAAIPFGSPAFATQMEQHRTESAELLGSRIPERLS